MTTEKREHLDFVWKLFYLIFQKNIFYNFIPLVLLIFHIFTNFSFNNI